MNSRHSKASLMVALTAVVCVAAGINCLISRSELAKRSEILGKRSDACAKLVFENKRLKVVRPSPDSGPALSDTEFQELLRLRSEVGRLRSKTNEAAALRKTNEALTVEKSKKEAADRPEGPDFWPKDQLTNAGRASPEATLKTALWAMNKGDVQSLMASFATEVRAKLPPENQVEDGQKTSLNSEVKQMTEWMIGSATGFRVTEQRVAGDGKVNLRVYFAGEGVTRGFVLKRQSEGDWKICDIQLAGQTGPGK